MFVVTKVGEQEEKSYQPGFCFSLFVLCFGCVLRSVDSLYIRGFFNIMLRTIFGLLPLNFFE